MIIVTIGSVKIKYQTMEDAVAALFAIKTGEAVTEEITPYPGDNIFHPAKWPTLEIAIIDAKVTPWPEKKEGPDNA